MNFEMLNMMEKKINELNKENITNDDENDLCEHDFRNAEGSITCIKCGIVETYLFCDDNELFNPHHINTYRPYLRKKHMKDTLRRLTDYFFVENKEVNISDIPQDMKEIRKYLKKNKLKLKNDFYYWRIKNNINVYVSADEISVWSCEFEKNRKLKAKDFIFDKLNRNAKYKDIAVLFERKIKK